MPTKLTSEIITAAILGFEEQKRHIDTKIAELRAMLSGGPANPAVTSEAPKRKRRKMSAAGRKAIAEAQRKRWAVSRKVAEPSAPATPKRPKPKHRMSKEGLARIIAANKKRWRLQKAAAKAQSTAKKAAPAQKKVAVKKAATKKAAVKAPPAQAARKASAKRPKKASALAPTMAEVAG